MDDSKSQNSNVFFSTLEEKNQVTAQAKFKFSLLSHTPANRNECPCCTHFLTTPANTSIFSLTLKNDNFKFVTLTRAPSQPVALFIAAIVSIVAIVTVVFIAAIVCINVIATIVFIVAIVSTAAAVTIVFFKLR